MNEELVQIYNAVRRSHCNLMSLLVDKLINAIAQHSTILTEIDLLTSKISKLTYHNCQKNTLMTIRDLLKSQGISVALITEMIESEEKEIHQTINWIYAYFMRHTNDSPIPNYIIVRTKNFLGRVLPPSTEYDEHGWPIEKKLLNSPTAQPLRPA